MASPRKKIEQSTGRILRTRKDDRGGIQPLIVDIVDSHSVYQGQWLKRKTYYRKCAYNIEGDVKGKRGPSAEVEAEDAPAPSGCLIMDD